MGSLPDKGVYMRFTPGKSWTWSYKKVDKVIYLVIFLQLDDGKQHYFMTNFTVGMLRQYPKNNLPFCIRECLILNDFAIGLDQAGCKDTYLDNNGVSVAMRIALNALACSLFVKIPVVSIDSCFLPCGNLKGPLKRGTVVSLYTSSHMSFDFIVLDSPDEVRHSLYRLMYINTSGILGRHRFRMGTVVRASLKVMCSYRAFNKSQFSSNYYA